MAGFQLYSKKTTKSGYPYVVMALFFAFTIIPLFTGLTVDSLISLIMIPAMIMNAYMNIALIRSVKQYPEQWKRATLHMPTPIFNCLCAAGFLCACAVGYYLFKDLDTVSKILCIIILAAMLVIAQICLRTGKVKKEDLMSKRERIAAAAIAATSDED